MLLAFGLLVGIASANDYYEGEDICLPENQFDDSGVPEDDFAVTANIYPASLLAGCLERSLILTRLPLGSLSWN